jgi:hypothetical protein
VLDLLVDIFHQKLEAAKKIAGQGPGLMEAACLHPALPQTANLLP